MRCVENQLRKRAMALAVLAPYSTNRESVGTFTSRRSIVFSLRLTHRRYHAPARRYNESVPTIVALSWRARQRNVSAWRPLMTFSFGAPSRAPWPPSDASVPRSCVRITPSTRTASLRRGHDWRRATPTFSARSSQIFVAERAGVVAGVYAGMEPRSWKELRDVAGGCLSRDPRPPYKPPIGFH
jgi:hypothetical protein